MKAINVDSDVFNDRMPFLKKKILEIFGDKTVSIYGINVNEELYFIVMCTGRGILVKSNGEIIRFGTGLTGALITYEKNGYSISPRVKYDLDCYGTGSSDASIKDKMGNEASLSILPSTNDDALYSTRVCFSQYNIDKDMFCEINYDYMDNGGTIYPGLLNRVESVNFYEDAIAKGMGCKRGFVPKRMQLFSRSEIDSDSLNYTFISFGEHGILNTLLKGSYNLYDGAGYITRFCKLGFMNFNHKFVELPFPFGEYKTEEDIFDMVSRAGFMTSVPRELIRVFNDEDKDYLLIQEFLSHLSEYKKDNNTRKLISVK